ncbi:MAG: ketoacyl-ACP synthase III [Chloroflexi bacterium]|nr:ketoacyl-ACP synthase III [Chloroflexota bacterium]
MLALSLPNSKSNGNGAHRKVRAEIVGWGMCAPRRVMTNDELAAMLDTSDEWIRGRTGIARRHIVSDGETTASMAIAAAQDALQVADADPREIDLVIVATSTPDHVFPSTACQVQDALAARHAGAFDLNAACSGFVYALAMGHQAIASGEHQQVLVIGADALSSRLDWTDRGTCILFGDGAGAVLLRATDADAGVMATVLGADGSGGELLKIPAGGCAVPTTHESVTQGLHYLRMDGRLVYRFASGVLAEAAEQVAHKAGWEVSAIDRLIPHQANVRIIESAAKRLGLPMERFVVNLEEYGNTSAASVPIALCEAIEAGTIRPGDQLVMVGFGAGLTWAAAAVKWRRSPEEVYVSRQRRWWRWSLYQWAHLRSGVRRGLGRLAIWFIRTVEGRDDR